MEGAADRGNVRMQGGCGETAPCTPCSPKRAVHHGTCSKDTSHICAMIAAQLLVQSTVSTCQE